MGETGGHGTGRHAACGAVRMTGRFEGDGGFGGDERQRACREDEANMLRRREDVGELTCGGGRAGLCGAARGREDVGRRGVRRGSRDGRGRRGLRCQLHLSNDALPCWHATAGVRRSAGRAQLRRRPGRAHLAHLAPCELGDHMSRHGTLAIGTLEPVHEPSRDRTESLPPIQPRGGSYRC